MPFRSFHSSDFCFSFLVVKLIICITHRSINHGSWHFVLFLCKKADSIDSTILFRHYCWTVMVSTWLTVRAIITLCGCVTIVDIFINLLHFKIVSGCRIYYFATVAVGVICLTSSLLNFYRFDYKRNVQNQISKKRIYSSIFSLHLLRNQHFIRNWFQ